jgi:hypothetical protein
MKLCRKSSGFLVNKYFHFSDDYLVLLTKEYLPNMKLKPNYKVREIAGEKMVVMQGKDGVDLTKVILLNTSAEWLWNSLQGKDFTLESAAQLLEERYKIGKEQSVTDAGKWIASMVKVGLIET